LGAPNFDLRSELLNDQKSKTDGELIQLHDKAVKDVASRLLACHNAGHQGGERLKKAFCSGSVMVPTKKPWDKTRPNNTRPNNTPGGKGDRRGDRQGDFDKDKAKNTKKKPRKKKNKKRNKNKKDKRNQGIDSFFSSSQFFFVFS